MRRKAGSLETPMARLMRIYREAGFRVQTGLNSYHFHGWRDAPFTLLFEKGKPFETGGGGVSLYEIPFLEHLSLAADFRSIFIVGNSFGWSTLLFGMLWPEAKVMALDCGISVSQDWLQRLLQWTTDRISGTRRAIPVSSDSGIVLTNDLARKHGLNVEVVKGYSPTDVSKAVSQHLPEKPDLVFIDGYHTPAQVLLDFEAARQAASPECIYLFHDVVNWKLEQSFAKIRSTPGMFGTILWRTMSGIGFLCPQEQRAAFAELLELFGESDETVRNLRVGVPRQMRADRFTQMLIHSRLAKGVRALLGGRSGT
jgi:hypothetical protein